MTQRTCENCRWWNRHSGLSTGDCQKRPPNSITSKWPSTDEADFCGEWANKTITPEQEAKRELVRCFAVAIVSAGLGEHFADEDVWFMASRMADAEPGNSGREI